MSVLLCEEFYSCHFCFLDLQVSQKIQSVVAYPVELSDVYLDGFRKHLEKAAEITLRLEEMKPGTPSKGLVCLTLWL